MNEMEIIRQHLDDDVPTLALKDHWFGCYDKKWLLQQIQARQKAKSKLPSLYGNFDFIFPPPLSVEQSSSELTARYKSSLVQGNRLLDLTGGMGIDTMHFAQNFKSVLFVEKQKELALIAEQNFRNLNLPHIKVLNEDSMEYLPHLPIADCIFLDPARRKADKKVFRLEDCEPNILPHLSTLLTKSDTILIKLSPMLDIKQILEKIPTTSSIHLVAVQNEIKELLVLITASKKENVVINCVNIDKNGHQNLRIFPENLRQTAIDYATNPARYIYEPHATILKAGMMNAEAHQWKLQKLHPHSQLFTSNSLQPEFMGRIFEVHSVFGLSKQELRQHLAGISHANITIRNFPIDEKTLRKKLKLKDGGDITLFATTLYNQKHVLILTQLPPSQ